MPHLHRFFHLDLPPQGGDVALSRDESHHAMRVLRVREGDQVELFNGQGSAAPGTIAALSRNDVQVALDEARFVPREEPGLALLQAWLHRDKPLDELVRQATVLGVDHILFFRADHSEKAPKTSEKWERIVVEACKQCGRLWFPEITTSASLAEALDRVTGNQIVVASMEGPHQPLRSLHTNQPISWVVGPEGDFSPDELQLLHTQGATPISLGAYTFRSEAAALTGLTMLQYHLGRLG